MEIGNKYKFTNDGSKPLVYIGKEGNWHQFEEEENQGVVWSELLDSDLWMIEEIKG